MTRLAGYNKMSNKRPQEDGYTFGSTAELREYHKLKAMEAIGEIWGLKVHPRFPLYAHDVWGDPDCDFGVQIAEYEADFLFRFKGEDIGSYPHVIDVKGHRTAMYELKKKWVKACHGITIEEIPAE